MPVSRITHVVAVIISLATPISGALAPFAESIGEIALANTPEGASCVRVTTYSTPPSSQPLWFEAQFLGVPNDGVLLLSAWSWSHPSEDDTFLSIALFGVNVLRVEDGWEGRTEGAGSESPYAIHTYYWAEELPPALFGIGIDSNGVIAVSFEFYEYCEMAPSGFERGPVVVAAYESRPVEAIIAGEQRTFAGAANVSIGGPAAGAIASTIPWESTADTVALLATGARAEGNSIGASALRIARPDGTSVTPLNCPGDCISDPLRPSVATKGGRGLWEFAVDASARTGKSDLFFLAASGDLTLL